MDKKIEDRTIFELKISISNDNKVHEKIEIRATNTSEVLEILRSLTMIQNQLLNEK